MVQDLDLKPRLLDDPSQAGAAVPALVADGQVELTHRALERRHEQHHAPAPAHQSGEGPHRSDVVRDVLEDVVRHDGRVLGRLLDGHEELVHAEDRIAGEALPEARQPDRVGLAGRPGGTPTAAQSDA